MSNIDDLNASVILKKVSEYINDDVNIVDALVYFAEKNEIEIEIIAEIVRRSPTLKNKVLEEAEHLNLVEVQSKLPL